MECTDAYDEKLLLQQIAEDNEQAFSRIVEHYWNNIYSQALAYLKSSYAAQDVVQEVFIKVWEKRKGFTDIDRFDSFLFIIARNHIISELRKKIMLPVNDDLEETLKEENNTPDKRLSLKQSHEMVAKAIDLLPGQQKIAFLLSRDEGLSYEEIAIRMQLSKETIKKHIGRALNFLRTYIRTHSEMIIWIILIAK